MFIEYRHFDVTRRHLAAEVKRMSYEDLLTKYSKVAADWALQYFDVEKFDTTRSRELSEDFSPIEGIFSDRRKDHDQPFQTPGPSSGALTWPPPNVRSFGSDPRSQRPSATRHYSDNTTATSPSAFRSTGRSNIYNLRRRQTPGASPSSGLTIANSPPS